MSNPNPNSVHVGILVRVEWPINDDPQTKALQFLQDLLGSSIDTFYDKQDPSKSPTNPYFLKGNIWVQSDPGHGLISVFYASKE